MPVARHPPHRSVRERLSHTAPASDDGGGASPTTASAPHAVQRLCHGFPASVCGPCRAQLTFSSAQALPSRSSAGGPPLLFGPFAGTTAQSDSSATYAWGVRAPSPHRPAARRQSAAEVSRFSRKEFPDVHGVSDRAGVPPPLAKARRWIWPSLSVHKVGTRKEVFRGSIGGPSVPLSTLHPRCRHRRRMTRGQRSSLNFRCGALASPTPRRFYPGAFGQALCLPRRDEQRPRVHDSGR